jgi:hypothetical protein
MPTTGIFAAFAAVWSALPLAAQSPHSAALRWHLADFLVTADSAAGVTVYASLNLASKQGSSQQQLDWVSVDSATAVQWAGFLRPRLDSAAVAAPPTQGLFLGPFLNDQCHHRWLGVGVEPQGRIAQLTLLYGDSVANRKWRVFATREELDTLLADMVATASYGATSNRCWGGNLSDADDSLLTVRRARFEPPRVVSEKVWYPERFGEYRCWEGRVWLRFAVDTAGRAEVSSSQALVSDSQEFLDEVRDALPRARFRAARINGRPVRMWTVQAFVFRAPFCPARGVVVP